MRTIKHIPASALGPGVLGECFREGAAAVVVEGDPAVGTLWRQLMAEPQSMPWASTLYDLSANLLPHDDLTKALGDLYYFKPGRHSYIARKIEISMDDAGLAVRPERFRILGEDVAMNAPLIDDCWAFASSIMAALGPTCDGREFPDSYRVAVQRLKYHESHAGHEALFRMVRNSLGPWARLGYMLDRSREEMRGPLARRGVSDAFALLSLIPFFRWCLTRLHAVQTEAGGVDVPDGCHVIVKAHIDTRYFSALCGNRYNLKTEIWTNSRWLPLPIDCENVAIVPGSGALTSYGIQPTLHRVLQEEAVSEGQVDPLLRNVTLLLGAK
ncbi:MULTISPECIES: hypothetical protein [unclassified Sphingomonas]|uniref:hypothetical protein n=1 Tax=unclassified Sphingomonas TaxID=196159 RepID=UPI0006F269A3|nr:MULTISPECIES: hypothetical protein [unclassified Sphingomonas]KQX19479.1 hypothetical protein ASD17_13220 [Sphingomonas sp. Root1294]KQY65680.1 hypothetical protein ASD39_16420 [Sphingomonas sp. Root50]KRB95016.1 hypothetical protein ASE22_03635 [Sphingomonas sp. Root720]